MKVIIVDDEPKAIELIASYLTHFSDFELVKTFRNGLKALEFLNNHIVDVIFLDINMPHLSGLSLSKMVPENTSVVFTTAYAEYAVESYTVNAIDYLLKPVSLERFSQTIIKLTKKESLLEMDEPSNRVFIKSGSDTHQINVSDIIYLEKDGNYIHYFTATKKIMARATISETMQQLSDDFIQIQKSFIVNFKKIDIIGTEYVVIAEAKIPIGFQFKAAFLEKVKSST